MQAPESLVLHRNAFDSTVVTMVEAESLRTSVPVAWQLGPFQAFGVDESLSAHRAAVGVIEVQQGSASFHHIAFPSCVDDRVEGSIHLAHQLGALFQMQVDTTREEESTALVAAFAQHHRASTILVSAVDGLLNVTESACVVAGFAFLHHQNLRFPRSEVQMGAHLVAFDAGLQMRRVSRECVPHFDVAYLVDVHEHVVGHSTLVEDEVYLRAVVKSSCGVCDAVFLVAHHLDLRFGKGSNNLLVPHRVLYVDHVARHGDGLLIHERPSGGSFRSVTVDDDAAASVGKLAYLRPCSLGDDLRRWDDDCLVALSAAVLQRSVAHGASLHDAVVGDEVVVVLMACQLVGSSFHEVVGAVVAQPQRRNGCIDGGACGGFSLLHEPCGAVHVVVQLFHSRVGHVTGGSALTHPEHELEEVDAPGQLVVDNELHTLRVELSREGGEALAESPWLAVDMSHRRGQSRELCLCAHPNLAPDDIDAGHLYAAQTTERVALHLHAPREHIVFVHVGDVLHAVGLTPVGLLLEVVIGEESAPHVPVVGLCAPFLLGGGGIVERCSLVAEERLQVGRGVVALLLLEDFLHASGPRHALESRFVAAESQHHLAQHVA